MKLEEFEILNKVIEELKKLEIVNWKIVNINLSYLSAGEINIKLHKETENSTQNTLIESPQSPE